MQLRRVLLRLAPGLGLFVGTALAGAASGSARGAAWGAAAGDARAASGPSPDPSACRTGCGSLPAGTDRNTCELQCDQAAAAVGKAHVVRWEVDPRTGERRVTSVDGRATNAPATGQGGSPGGKSPGGPSGGAAPAPRVLVSAPHAFARGDLAGLSGCQARCNAEATEDDRATCKLVCLGARQVPMPAPPAATPPPLTGPAPTPASAGGTQGSAAGEPARPPTTRPSSVAPPAMSTPDARRTDCLSACDRDANLSGTDRATCRATCDQNAGSRSWRDKLLGPR